MDTGAVVVRVFWLCVLSLILFFVLVRPMAILGTSGPTTTAPVRARMRSRLDAETLRQAMTYYPGRSDDKVVCGAADAEGRFPVTIRLAFDVLTFQDDPTPEMNAVGMSMDGVMECHSHAVVHSADPDHHEIFFFDGGSDAVTVSKHSFHTLRNGGTAVVLEEAGMPMTWGERFGMWFSDYLADYTTDQTDQAEGRRTRANRSFVHKQLVVDLANILVPWLNAQWLEEPGDDRSQKTLGN